MRLMSFRDSTGSRFGIVDGDVIIDANLADSRIPNDLSAFLRGGGTIGDLRKLAKNKAAESISGLVHELPLSSPNKIFCLGLNYLEHVK